MDDFFITFRYANNIATGRGFVFNEGERVLATTTPLLTILLAGLRLTGIMPELAVRWICSLTLMGSAIMFFLLHRQRKEDITGLTGGLLFFFIPPLMQLWGNEVTLCMFFILSAIYFNARKQYNLSALFQGLYGLTRGEGVLFSLYIQFVTALREKKLNFYSLLILGILLVPWYLFSFLYFGEIFPNTLPAKIRQGVRLDVLNSYTWGLLENFRRIFFPKNLFILILTWLGGLKLLLNIFKLKRWSNLVFLKNFIDEKRTDYLLLTWIALHQIAYYCIGVPGSYEWYFYTLWLLHPILPAYGLSVFFSEKHQQFMRMSSGTRIIYAILIAVLLYYYSGQPRYNNFFKQRYELYKHISKELEEIPRGKLVLADEIGIFGYFLSELRFCDISGLIHKEITAEDIYRQDYFLRQFKPDIFINTVYINKPDSVAKLPDKLTVIAENGEKIIYQLTADYSIPLIRVRVFRKLAETIPADIK
ncbi:MAG: hypothetical protein N2246_03760 [Candidatus Sumerlaeia bacterium]|nr:hypothetical protein [Candidatus Sumerlaeia bacterium]